MKPLEDSTVGRAALPHCYSYCTPSSTNCRYPPHICPAYAGASRSSTSTAGRPTPQRLASAGEHRSHLEPIFGRRSEFCYNRLALSKRRDRKYDSLSAILLPRLLSCASGAVGGSMRRGCVVFEGIRLYEYAYITHAPCRTRARPKMDPTAASFEFHHRIGAFQGN